MKKKLGTLGKGFGRKKEKGMAVKATRKTRLETLKCFCCWEKRSFSHNRRHITDRNGQIVDICPLNFQTKFRDDPTVNECRRALLPRQLP